MSEEFYPLHWKCLPIKAVMPNGKSVNPANFPDKQFELWSVPAFPISPEYLSGNEIGSTKQLVQPEDVLLCKINPRINRVWKVVANIDGVTQIASSEWIVLRSKFWCSDFVRVYLSSLNFREKITANVSGVGGSLTRARPTDVGEYEIPIPPLSEQRRIADRIDALQARSRRAREALAEAQTLLEQFRQSVLSAAFRGDLTAKWREEHPDAEPASELLKRIRAERRKRWEKAELVKYTAKGKTPPPDWRKKYPEPVRVDTADLPELSQGWCWASLDELIYDGPTNGYSPKTHAGAEGSVSLKLSATSQGYFILDTTTTKPLPEVISRDSYLWLEPGDLLIQRANTIDLVGTAAVYKAEPKAYVYPDLMSRVRLVFPFLIKWIWQMINSPTGREYIKQNAVGIAGNMPKINATTIRNMPVPLPPQDELLICCKKLIASHQKNLHLRQFYIDLEAKLNAIDQSILAKAFRGELVPQNPDDEPTAKLLERILSEVTTGQDAKKRHSRGKS